jgi:uncharacterized protein (TIRG00374 family)
VGAILIAAHPVWVLAVLIASAVSVYIRAQRWRVLLRPLGDVPLYPALSATAIGFGASSVLPFRLGEILRPALLGRSSGVGMSAALSSVVLERLFDILLVIACFLAVSLVYPEVPPSMRHGAIGLSAVVGFGFLLLILAQRHRRLAEAWIGRSLGWLPTRVASSLRPVVASFLSGLDGLSDLPTVLLVLWYSIYLWGVIALTFLFSFLALDTNVPLLAASLTTAVIVAAAVFLPQAPGFIGTWQIGCVIALHQIFHVKREIAVGYSLLTWILQMVINLGLAGVFLAREDLSLAQLLRIAPRNASTPGLEGR